MLNYQLAGGAYTDSKSLIDLKQLASSFNLFSRHKVNNHLSGEKITNARGRGLSFAEVRRYQPGDDVRMIDWRVTARTGKTHTKLFHQESSQPFLLIIDQNMPMFFGSQYVFKSVLAAQISSILAWQIIKAHNGFSALVATPDNNPYYLPIGYKQKTVLEMISSLDRLNHSLNNARINEGHSLLATLKQAVSYRLSGYSIIIVSDFNTPQKIDKYLYALQQHNGLFGIMLFDRLEQHLPSYGMYTANDGRQDYLLNTQDKQLAKDLYSSFTKRVEDIRSLFVNAHQFISLETKQYGIDSLNTAFTSSMNSS